MLNPLPRLTFACLASVLLANSALAAPPPYAPHLARVYQGILDITTTMEGCSAIYPGTAASSRQALQDWRERNGPLLAEVQQRYRLWLASLAPGKPAHQRTHARIMKDKFDQRRTVLLAQLRAQPAARGRESCHNHAVRLQSGPDPTRAWSADLQQLRRLQPLSGSRS